MDVLTKLVIAPVGMKISVFNDFVDFFRNQIPKETPLEKDDIITITMLGQDLEFKVIEVEPSVGIFQDETEVKILGEPPRTLQSAYEPFREVIYPTEFIAKVISGGRITIPEEYRELHNIQEGDILAISFKVIKTLN